MRLFYKASKPTPEDLEIYDELCKGRTLRDVGEEFNLSHSTVAEIRDKVERWNVPKMQNEIGAIKARQTNSLDHTFRECMAAWEKSKADTVTVIKEVTKDGKTQTITKRVSSCGDPRFLSQARAALADIRQIWNFEKHNEEGRPSSASRYGISPAGMERDVYRVKVAKAQLAEAQEFLANLREEGIDTDCEDFDEAELEESLC